MLVMCLVPYSLVIAHDVMSRMPPNERLIHGGAHNAGDKTACQENSGSTETTICNKEEVQDCIPLQRYIEELKSENDGWKDLYQKVKKNYEETCRKLKLNPLKLDWDCCADLLTDEEKAFLSDKPDYKRIRRDIKLLLEKQQHSVEFAVETAMVMDRTMSVANLQKDRVQKRIVEHSLS